MRVMATNRIDGNLQVSGNLQVDGQILPAQSRSFLAQDNFANYGIPFSNLRIWDAFQTPIGTAAADDLGLSTGGTYGTNAPYISAGDLKNAGATTRRARFMFTLPPEYVAAESVRISAIAGMITSVASTSCTIDFEAFEVLNDGNVTGADLVTTAAVTMNSLTFSEKAFDLTATGLLAGDTLDIRVSIACTDSATATAVIPAISALRLQLDIKG
jgi:hypothetical protein